MDYKEKIIELLNEIDSQKALRIIYNFVDRIHELLADR